MKAAISTRRTFWAWPSHLRDGRLVMLDYKRKGRAMVRVRVTILPGQRLAEPLMARPTWARAEARGLASVVQPAANPYREGSHCWMVFEVARCRALRAAERCRALRSRMARGGAR